jgi:formylglycine-generating enzyme required for sulfatase activity
LKPNDLGFFDMQGNVYTWCQERFKSYPQSKGAAIEDAEDIYSINIIETRVLRGGSFGPSASLIRSAQRGYYPPANHYFTIGFRPARTYH